MDLTDVLKEASIIDHDWQTEGLLQPGKLTFDPKEEGIKKRNNTKPELEVEWGNAGPNVDLNEPAGKVVRNIPPEDLAGAKDVIIFARDQMNRGRMGKTLTGALKAKFDPVTLKAASGELRKLFALEGIVGCIAVDGRGYKSCQEAIKVASSSPYKHFIKYVVGCQCGDPHHIPMGQNTAIGPIASSSGNAVDDFFASEAPKKMEMVSHCRSTMMPILAWRGDLDQSMTDQTLIELNNMSGLNESQYRQLSSARKSGKISSNLTLVRDAFRMLNANRERLASEKYAAKVDNSEHIVRASETEVEFFSAPMSDLDVDPVNHSLQQEVEPVEPFPSTTFDGPPSLFSELDEVDLAGQPDMSQIPVELTDESDPSKLGLFDKLAPMSQMDVGFDGVGLPVSAPNLSGSPIELNPSDGQMQVPLDDEMELMGDIPIDRSVAPVELDTDRFFLQDVEMDQFNEAEFEGVGDIEFGETIEREDDLDVSMNQDMRI